MFGRDLGCQQEFGGTWVRHRCLEGHGIGNLCAACYSWGTRTEGQWEAGFLEAIGRHKVKDFICQARDSSSWTWGALQGCMQKSEDKQRFGCVCVHMCAYVYVAECVYVPVHVCICVCMCVLPECVNVWMCVHVPVCMCVNVCMCVCA